jgi:hypothetical protein
MMPNASNSQDSIPQVDDMWIPEGFVLVIGPNNQKYIVPEYCVPDLDIDYLSNEKKKELGATNAQGTVSFSFCIHIENLPADTGTGKCLVYPESGNRQPAV